MTTSISDGTQSAVLSTEHVLDTISVSGSYVLMVDTSNMVNGDKLVLRVKVKIRSVGNTTLAYAATYAHVQGEPAKLSIPVASTNEVSFSLELVAGTGKSFPWEVVGL